MEKENKKEVPTQSVEASQEIKRDELSTLQTEAANALNSLVAALRKEKYRVITPVQLLSTVFSAKNDDNNGFRFEPINLSGADCLKYDFSRDDEDTGSGGITTTKPLSRDKPIEATNAKNKAKFVNKGV